MDETNEREVLDVAEKAGIENLRMRHDNADAINREAHATLLLLLGATAAAGAYGFGVFDAEIRHPPQMWAAFAVSFYLAAVAAWLVWANLRPQPFPGLYNAPKNIFQPEYAVLAIRRTQLELLQERIEQATVIVRTRAQAVARVRVAALLSPLVALGAAVCARLA